LIEIGQTRVVHADQAQNGRVDVMHRHRHLLGAQPELIAGTENLAALGPPASGAAGPAAADLIPKDLAEGKKSGFLYTLEVTATGYAITAIPEKFSSSGRRSFYSDQTLVVRNNWTAEPANANSAEIK